MVDWQVLNTGTHSAEDNMRQDAKWLEDADLLDGPILHFYEWEKPSVTYGYFVKPEQLLNLSAAHAAGLDLARRPTGGGIVFHPFDMAFSVVVPSHCSLFSINTLDNYALVNRAVLQSVHQFWQGDREVTLTPQDGLPMDSSCMNFCMAKPTKYDVMWQGKKVAGAAQRKTKKGFLHQGMISLVMPPAEFLSQVLLPGSLVLDATVRFSSPLLGLSATAAQIEEAKQFLQRLLTTQLRASGL